RLGPGCFPDGWSAPPCHAGSVRPEKGRKYKSLSYNVNSTAGDPKPPILGPFTTKIDQPAVGAPLPIIALSRYFFAAMNASAHSLTIWCNAKFTPNAMAELKGAVERSGHRLILLSAPPTSNLVSSDRDAELEGADIALRQPDPQQVMFLPRLRWVHLTSAGYTRYDRDDLRAALRARGAILTNSSLVYQEPCAEHCLAMMLALARRLPQCVVDQHTTRPW